MCMKRAFPEDSPFHAKGATARNLRPSFARLSVVSDLRLRFAGTSSLVPAPFSKERSVRLPAAYVGQ